MGRGGSSIPENNRAGPAVWPGEALRPTESEKTKRFLPLGLFPAKRFLQSRATDKTTCRNSFLGWKRFPLGNEEALRNYRPAPLAIKRCGLKVQKEGSLFGLSNEALPF